MTRARLTWRRRAVRTVASAALMSVLAAACDRSAAPVAEQPVPDDPVPPNIVWIVVDLPDGEATVPIESLLGGGVRLADTRSVGTSASTRSVLLTGMPLTALGIRDDRLSALPAAGIVPLPERMRRAGYYTSRSGPALHNLSLGTAESDHVPDASEQYQPGLLGAWDAAGAGVDWRGRNLDWDLPCEVAFGCDRTVSGDLRPFFSVFNVLASDDTSLGREVTSILAALETDRVVDNTVVFFLGLRATDFEMVVRWPQRLQAGTMRDDAVSVVDLAPTVLSLAGVVVPRDMKGRAFLETTMPVPSAPDDPIPPSRKAGSSPWPDGRPPRAAAPVGYPRGGMHHGAPQVDLWCDTEDSTITYTTERIAPFYWRLYDGTFRMRFWTLRAKCGRLGYLDSAVTTYDFTIE